MKTFRCFDCKQWKLPLALVNGSGGTGYAIDKNRHKVCYDCCAKRDSADMVKTGKGYMYLHWPHNEPSRAILSPTRENNIFLTNWPGTLKIPVGSAQKGRHNIAGSRYSVWFTGPDGKPWFGVQYGENTQICHVRRLKE